jgi:hypothetical protein
MMGLAASAADLVIASEFFELFKTPWEPAVPGRKYAAIVSAGQPTDDLDAEVIMHYDSNTLPDDARRGVRADTDRGPSVITWNGSPLPIYGSLARFDTREPFTDLRAGDRSVVYRASAGHQEIWRFGYDLFAEVRRLLTEGQPVEHAATPTLELHIALLRASLTQSGVSFVEIPPRPDGFDFACCLTHDIDFCGIRRHKLDRTLAGFVARALVGTAADVVRGRRPLGDVWRNASAVLSLPLVFLGVSRDFWQPFDDYARAEAGRPSTFFVVPFRDRPGVSPEGTVDPARAVPYQMSDVRNDLQSAAARGSEIAVHGVDAWRSADAGRAELDELRATTGQASAGIRMHWLYYTQESPAELERAGYTYDSTWGYNEAIGYRAGTSQAFQLPGTRMMELPLSIMDSALLFPARMGLAAGEALERSAGIVENARRFGGTVVVNWHDRSLAPERLWDGCYERLLDDIGADGRAWFAGAGEAVRWFQWRRSIRFAVEEGAVTMTACTPTSPLPAGVVHVHHTDRGTGASIETHRLAGGQPLTVQL